MTKRTAKTEGSFEAAVQRLEEIAARMESADVPLEEALALFEEGIQQLGAAMKLLERTEGTVRQLSDKVVDVVAPDQRA